MNELSIPQPVRRVLEELRRLDGRAHLAGGAVRDTLLGRPVKDWDIFVPTNIRTDKVHEIVGRTPESNVYGPQYFGWSTDIIGTAEYRVPRYDPDTSDAYLDLNVIHLTRKQTLEENLERFDWGLCRVGLNENGYVVEGYGYDLDVMTKSFVLRACENADQFGYAMTRYHRLRKKYNDWALFIPGKFAQFATSDFDLC
jgi:hypothetical protein